MTTIEELKTEHHNQALIRKLLNGVAVIAPYSAEAPTAFTGTGGQLIPFPEAYSGLGIVEKGSGYEWSLDQDTEEVEGHGYSSPVRIDIVKTTRGVKATFLETRRSTIEAHQGIDLSTATVDETTGAISWAEPENVTRPYSRLAVVGSDGFGEDLVHWIRFMPRAQVTEVESQQWSTEALTYGLTWTAFVDPVLGYSVKNFLAGPGAAKFAADMGFGAAGESPAG